MTTDELSFDGRKYVSVKRASELTGYTRDYVGQLARGGKIDARRMGRAWFVDEGALLTHKANADLFVPTPPPPVESDARPVESFVHLDGNEYISAKRASELLGYNPDYVSQMARDGKVKSTQLGSRWFVAKRGIEEHKARTDASLAAFQAESSGLVRPQVTRDQLPQVCSAPANLYFTDSRPLFPEIPERQTLAMTPAHFHENSREEAAPKAQKGHSAVIQRPIVVRKSNLPVPVGTGLLPMVVGGLILILSIGLPTAYALYSSNPAMSAVAASAAARVTGVTDMLPDSILSKELTFKRR